MSRILIILLVWTTTSFAQYDFDPNTFSDPLCRYILGKRFPTPSDSRDINILSTDIPIKRITTKDSLGNDLIQTLLQNKNPIETIPKK